MKEIDGKCYEEKWSHRQIENGRKKVMSVILKYKALQVGRSCLFKDRRNTIATLRDRILFSFFQSNPIFRGDNVSCWVINCSPWLENVIRHPRRNMTVRRFYSAIFHNERPDTAIRDLLFNIISEIL